MAVRVARPAGPVLFVTGNDRKVAEVVAILGDSFPRTLVRRDVSLVEEQGSVERVAERKCLLAAETLAPEPVLVEDTALAFDALGGLPGPYVKCFLERIGPEGLHAMLAGFADKRAEAICTFAFCEGRGSDAVLFQGRTRGEIVSPRGENAFGWDSCFRPDGHDLTYAQMPRSLKNEISHRRKAIDAMRRHFVE